MTLLILFTRGSRETHEMARKKFLTIVGFMAICGLLLMSFTKVMTFSEDYRNYQLISGFYEESKDSLDAVYIGGSNVYAFWIAPWAWENYGIAVYPFACDSQPLVAAKDMIQEARKTQPNALFIVSINTFMNVKPSEFQIHWLTDYMPESMKKFQLIEDLANLGGYSFLERLEFHFPLLCYHSRWNQLVKDDFYYVNNGFKGGSVYSAYLKSITDVSRERRITDAEGTLPGELEQSLEELFQYCRSENVHLLFVTAPQNIKDEFVVSQFNSLNRMIQSQGYPVIDMGRHIDDIGMDLTMDYYNTHHTNIHGSLKTTDYLARYLLKNYGFDDKRRDPEYDSWNEAYKGYSDYVSPYVLDIEWERMPRDYTLPAPKLLSVAVNGTELVVSWEDVPDADGYRIYRKEENSKWEPVADVPSHECTYADRECKAGNNYTYTVVASRKRGQQDAWGLCDYRGISNTAVLNAPRLLGLHGRENDLILSWEKVKDADGYAVLRRLPGKSWIEIADVKDNTIFTDKDMLHSIPYQYTVMAYYRDKAGNRKNGKYDEKGLFWNPITEFPEVTMNVSDDQVRFSWERVEGMTGYKLYRKEMDGDWMQLADDLSPDSTEFSDKTVREKESYAYRIVAYIESGGDVYEYPSDVLVLNNNMIRGEIDLEKPEITFLEQVGSQVCLSWDDLDGVTSYRIYRRLKKPLEDWEIIKTLSEETVCLDKPEKSGIYEYAVEALYCEDGFTYHSGVTQNDNPNAQSCFYKITDESMVEESE